MLDTPEPKEQLAGLDAWLEREDVLDPFDGEPPPDDDYRACVTEAQMPGVYADALTDEEAHRVIRRLARIRDEQVRVKAQCEAILRDLKREEEGVLFRHEILLQSWTAAQLRGRARSKKTPWGTVGFRKVPATVRVVDAEESMVWAADHDVRFLETIARFDVATFKHHLDDFRRVDPETGEVRYEAPPGVEIVPERDVFRVTTAKGTADDDAES